MKITAIRQQERLKGRYSIYIDEKYAFSLSADALLAEGLHSGMELDEAQLKAYKKLSADDKAYGLAIAYVARRMRSRYELTEYFRRKEYDEALVEQLLSRLERIGLIDDHAFAEAWVRNRRLLRSTSKRRLQQELRQKRIADHIIQDVLQEDETDERAVLRALVDKKRKQTRYQDETRLMRYLVSQGFGYDDVKAVLQNAEQD
jgi:regulatory protein